MKGLCIEHGDYLMIFKEYLREEFGYNEPIYLDDIKFQNYSRSWIFKELKKLVDNGVLRRFNTGIYYFPKKMPWGDSVLDANKIIRRQFLTDGKNIYGYVAGTSLLNKTGISTQIPNLLELVSNKETTRVRDIYVGNRRVRARRSRTTVTKDNVNVLQFFDLMSSISPSCLDETERYMLSKYIKASGVTRSDVTQYANFFPAKVMKNMMECGAVYELAY